MNYINAQKEILTEYLKEKKAVFGRVGDKVFYGTPFKIYVTPANKVGIDFKNVQPIAENTLKSFTDDRNLTDTYLTPEMVSDDKRILRVFENEKGKIYVDEKLLKNFNLSKSTFKGSEPNKPIFIYENEMMVGFVFPVRYKI